MTLTILEDKDSLGNKLSFAKGLIINKEYFILLEQNSFQNDIWDEEIVSVFREFCHISFSEDELNYLKEESISSVMEKRYLESNIFCEFNVYKKGYNKKYPDLFSGLYISRPTQDPLDDNRLATQYRGITLLHKSFLEHGKSRFTNIVCNQFLQEIVANIKYRKLRFYQS